jgi:hypothetical protein
MRYVGMARRAEGGNMNIMLGFAVFIAALFIFLFFAAMSALGDSEKENKDLRERLESKKHFDEVA